MNDCPFATSVSFILSRLWMEHLLSITLHMCLCLHGSKFSFPSHITLLITIIFLRNRIINAHTQLGHTKESKQGRNHEMIYQLGKFCLETHVRSTEEEHETVSSIILRFCVYLIYKQHLYTRHGIRACCYCVWKDIKWDNLFCQIGKRSYELLFGFDMLIIYGLLFQMMW